MASNKQFMQLAIEGAKIFSTCGKRKYMCILTDEFNMVVGMGYNGGPSGTKHCEDGGCPRFQENSAPGSAYDNCIAIHAEQNAFLHSDYNKAVRLYVNGPPCYTCAKLIANSSVKEVHYIIDEAYADFDKCKELLLNNGFVLYGYNAEDLEPEVALQIKGIY